MQEVELNAAARLLYPRLTVLVTTVNPAGEPNAAPYSWVAPVSFAPPMLYIGIQRRETLTIKNIKRTKEFVVNIVTKGWAEKAVACEAKLPDKVEKSGITLRESKKVNAPSVLEAKIVLECVLKDIVETGSADHYLVIGEIVHAEKDESMKDSEIVLHNTGSGFFLPSKKLEVQRKK